jgi:hypothetical protein
VLSMTSANIETLKIPVKTFSRNYALDTPGDLDYYSGHGKAETTAPKT